MATFDVTGRKYPQHPPLYSILFVRMQGKKVVSSTVILERKRSLKLNKYYRINCCCSTVEQLCDTEYKDSSYSAFSCLAEVLSHVVL